MSPRRLAFLDDWVNYEHAWEDSQPFFKNPTKMSSRHESIDRPAKNTRHGAKAGGRPPTPGLDYDTPTRRTTNKLDEPFHMPTPYIPDEGEQGMDNESGCVGCCCVLYGLINAAINDELFNTQPQPQPQLHQAHHEPSETQTAGVRTVPSQATAQLLLQRCQGCRRLRPGREQVQRGGRACVLWAPEDQDRWQNILLCRLTLAELGLTTFVEELETTGSVWFRMTRDELGAELDLCEIARGDLPLKSNMQAALLRYKHRCLLAEERRRRRFRVELPIILSYPFENMPQHLPLGSA